MPLTIGANTTLQNLQTFIKDAGEKTKIYGAKDSMTGEITLYLKEKSTKLGDRVKDKLKSLCDSISGTARTRRQVAREGIGKLMSRFTEKTVNDRAGNKSVAIQTKCLLESIQGRMGGFVSATNVMHLNKANRVGQLARMIGLTMDVAEKSQVLEPQQRERLQEESVEFDLGRLEKEFGLSKMTAEKGPSDMVSEGGTNATRVTIGEKTYDPVRCLARGGFGDVFLYKDTGSESKIVVKISHRDEEFKMESAIKEIEVHAKITQSSGDQVIKLLGATEMPDGTLGIATELAPNGDVQQLLNNIHSRIVEDKKDLGPGKLTRQEANVLFLTLLRDMAKGLHSLHTNSDLTHFDFKNPNVLIDGDGVAKIGDFGTSRTGKEVEFSKTEPIACTYYKSPEMEHTMQTHSKIKLKVVEGHDELRNQLYGIFPQHKGRMQEMVKGIGLEQSQVEIHKSLDVRGETTTLVRNPKMNDIWGLGANGVEMFTGKPLLSDFGKDQIDRENRLYSFALLNENAIAPPQNGDFSGVSLSKGTGDNEVDDFLNSLLKSNPQDRLSAFEIVNDSIFEKNGVDSNEVRSLIKALASNNDKDIDKERLRLAKIL